MNKKIYERICVSREFLDRKFDNRINVVKLSKSNTLEHELAKTILAHECLQLGQTFVSEARFKNNKRADIFVLDDCVAYEIVHSESKKSIEKKKKEYPVDVMFFKAKDVVERYIK